MLNTGRLVVELTALPRHVTAPVFALAARCWRRSCEPIGVAVAALVIAASVLGTVASAAHGAIPGFLAAGIDSLLPPMASCLRCSKFPSIQMTRHQMIGGYLLKLWLNLRALPHGEGATRVEVAARWGINR